MLRENRPPQSPNETHIWWKWSYLFMHIRCYTAFMAFDLFNMMPVVSTKLAYWHIHYRILQQWFRQICGRSCPYFFVGKTKILLLWWCVLKILSLWTDIRFSSVLTHWFWWSVESRHVFITTFELEELFAYSQSPNTRFVKRFCRFAY